MSSLSTEPTAQPNMTLITSKPVDPNWWRQALVYQIYPRSFCDLNGDGIGDLKGITSKVPYLSDLGVDAVWLSPFYPSALKDGGYDVADYRDVDPKIGTLEDFDEMTKAFKEANIQVIVDIVPNHSSDDHVWFQEALKSPKGSDARERYIFRDGAGPDGSQPPNDWQCCFGGPAWTQVPDGQWYLHLFDSSQPDLNWKHPDVQPDFLKTLRFWADRGVAGFRVDVAMGLAKDVKEPYPSHAELTSSRLNFDAGVIKGNDHPLWDRDEVLEIYKEWRQVFNEYDPPLTAVAEAWVARDRKHLYASSEGLGQTFSFDMLMCTYDAAAYLETITESLKLSNESGSSTTWVFSNHDVIRHATRYGIPESTTASGTEEFNQLCKDFLLGEKGLTCDPELGLKRARAATLMMLALPGSAYIYQGEELGLPEVVDIPAEARQDPTFFRWKGREIGRDGCRVPLPWTSSPPSFGFSPQDAKAAPHLPPPSWWGEFAVEKEEKEKESTLNLYKAALRLRQKLQTKEELEIVDSPLGVVRFRRPGGWEVIFNLSHEQGIEIPQGGEVLVASGPLDNGKVGKDTVVWVKV